MLKKEFQYYLDSQSMLVEKYNGRFLVIKDEKIQGDYKNQVEAYEEAVKRFELGTFLIQHCIAGSESYTQTFHSRVIVNNVFA